MGAMGAVGVAGTFASDDMLTCRSTNWLYKLVTARTQHVHALTTLVKINYRSNATYMKKSNGVCRTHVHVCACVCACVCVCVVVSAPLAVKTACHSNSI